MAARACRRPAGGHRSRPAGRRHPGPAAGAGAWPHRPVEPERRRGGQAVGPPGPGGGRGPAGRAIGRRWPGGGPDGGARLLAGRCRRRAAPRPGPAGSRGRHHRCRRRARRGLPCQALARRRPRWSGRARPPAPPPRNSRRPSSRIEIPPPTLPGGCDTSAMELTQVMRTAGSTRRFTSDPVPDDVVYRVLDNARFAPSGNNRQGWRVIVVRDSAVRVQLRDLYRKSWYTYHAPLFTPPGQPPTPDHYADHLDEVPVHLVVMVKQAALTTTIQALDASHHIGGASVYPFVQNLVLGLR